MSTLLISDLGRIEYLKALALQESLVQAKRLKALPDMLLLLEHPHVLTMGRRGKIKNLIRNQEIPFYRTSRGGDITYHGPGQLVAYPILDLKSRLRRDVHLFLRKLEQTTIETLKAFGITAARRPPWTGIWIGQRKIASMGIAVRKSITFHGLALNVQTDLHYFDRIIPCGLTWAEMTSMQKQLGKTILMEQVKDHFIPTFMKRFGYSERKNLCHEDIQIGLKFDSPEAPTTCASNAS